ncbi:MAG: hypothetical protein GF383_09450 [Candidatus Lokiarchaeota archaeon]|nr:hypothetical protein [Candidatus Lokiarchaeota archaeon]MBD3340738.1 hypothetical protein [Candidatus Lokiarchaeota archaeon]
MRKILGIMGSPRKNGNTHTLISKVFEGAIQQGAETEMVLLSYMNINECDGCHVCWKGEKCNKNDDMNLIYPKIIDSDIVIFGTPVYWYAPTGLMKLLIDRLVFFNSSKNRAKIKGKKGVLVVPFEEEGIDTAELTVKMFEKSLNYLEMPLIEVLLVPGVTKRGEVSERKDIMEKCYNLGKALVN